MNSGEDFWEPVSQYEIRIIWDIHDLFFYFLFILKVFFISISGYQAYVQYLTHTA